MKTMNRISSSILRGVAALAAGLWPCALLAASTPSLPNILWITCEDMSPNLGCYGDTYASTPNLDQLAQKSVRYSRAFATAPVCSPTRSCLITGLYATTLGTQNLRSRFPIPAAVQGFPTRLRLAGYHCSNNAKTDYNTANEPELIKNSWNECGANAHWRQRKAGQPFFSVFNLMQTHQSRSSVWSFEQFEAAIGKSLGATERHDPAKVTIPPYYPDTPTVRRTLARYYDCITAMDKEVGRILKELEDDGLADDTIVFFYSDHGAGLPRHKRVLYDSGLRVPLIIRFPEKFQQWAPAAPGRNVDRMVSFVDFGPTVLSLAEIEMPMTMQGRPFLGKFSAPPRQFVYGARDRVDEAYDLSRSVRDDRFLYIRNYLPHLSLNQPEGYSDQSDMRREIAQLAAQGRLTPAQLAYAGPGKAVEELYDTLSDPHQIHNLAAEPTLFPVVAKFRQELEIWQEQTFDLAYLPESEWRRRFPNQPPWEAARQAGEYPQREIIAAAELASRPKAAKEQTKLRWHTDSAVRYWAVVGLRIGGERSSAVREALRYALLDESPAVRIEAAAALVELGEVYAPLELLEKELKNQQPEVALKAARELQLLGDKARLALPDMETMLATARAREKESDHFMYLRFCLEPAVKNLK